MLQRHLHETILYRLDQFPAVALIGPRQAGKTTLARHIAKQRTDQNRQSLYVDLESPQDRDRLAIDPFATWASCSGTHPASLPYHARALARRPCERRRPRPITRGGRQNNRPLYFYRTAAGAEIDLLLAMPVGKLWAIEIKRGLAPSLEKGFHQSLSGLQPERSFVVYSGVERYRKTRDVEAIGLADMMRELSAA